MRHLIPSLCLALLLAETACSAPHAVKRGDSDARQKNAATRQRAESAYDELTLLFVLNVISEPKIEPYGFVDRDLRLVRS